MLTVVEIVPSVLLKLLIMVNQTIRHHYESSQSVESLQLLKSSLRPLLYPDNVKQRQDAQQGHNQSHNGNHEQDQWQGGQRTGRQQLYSEVADSVSRVLNKVERISPLFTAGSSSY